MTFNLKIGDSIILKKDRTKAVIISAIGDRKFKIIDNHGFEYLVYSSEILPLNLETDNYEAYGTSFDVKDEDIRKDKESPLFTNKTDSRGKIRIDLHIEQLTSYYVHMQNYEIVQMQMEYCKKELDLAMLKAKYSLEIVHGIGEGVLKEEVHKLLRLYNLSYFESNNGGSTEVML